MLPEPRRIRRAEEFRAVTRSGVRAAGRTVVVHVGPLPGRACPARAGLVVSRGVGGSVQRHRVARRLRHVLRDLIDDLPSGIGVVVRARPEALTCDAATLAEDVTRTLRRALDRISPGLPGGQCPGTHAMVSQ